MKKRSTKGSRKKIKSPRFNSVEEYLASQDSTKERTLRSLIELILTQFPELESKISWNVPTIHRNGKYVVGVCAYKHHLTFSAWSPRVIGVLFLRGEHPRLLQRTSLEDQGSYHRYFQYPGVCI